MLRLKGQTESGEWVEFWVHDIVLPSVDLSCVWVRGEYSPNVLTATIQPADDPRKQMLDEIQTRLKTLRWWPRFEDFKDLALVSLADVEEILHEHETTVIIDEMEAKL